MRNFLRFVVFVTALVSILVVVVGPLVARPLIEALVRDALPFEDDSVTVAVGLGPSLLAGEIETLSIEGRELRTDQVTIGRLKVDLAGFNVIDRSFKDIDGRLEDVELELEDNPLVVVDRVELGGRSEALTASVTLDARSTEQVVRSKLAELGIQPDAVRLTAGSLEIEAQGATVRATMSAHDGGLYLEAGRLAPPIALLESGELGPWLVMSATISASGLVIEATTTLEALLPR
jgi:hypothetical protein